MHVLLQLLRIAGATVEQGPQSVFLGLPLNLSPSIALSPRFAYTVDSVINHVKGDVSISGKSTMILDGDVRVGVSD